MNESLKLRDYQLECVETVLSEFTQQIHRQLISLPTGSGKTVIMSAIARQFHKKTLLIAHREELLTQSIDKFKLFWPGVDIGLCKAEYNEIHNQVVVGSVQSCSRPKRLDHLKEQGFELLMIDECHHSISNSYQSIINSLGFAGGSNRLLIGMTATPMRGDKQGLGDIFEKITYSRSIATMIRAGYLSPVVGRKILTNFSFDRIRSRNGDFDLGDLAEAVNTSERNEFIVNKFKEYANNRKGVAFCVDVQHCKDLADAFRKAGINAEAVYGDMPTVERETVLVALKSGKIQMVTSCGILTEGYDEPSIDVVVMARPTKSEGLYIQCVGRGLRLWPGKENCYVLDFTDKGHNLDAVMTLSNTIPEAIHVKEEDEQVEREQIDRTPKINVIESCDREFDILGSARFIWVQVGDEWSLQDDDKREIVMSPSDGGYIANLYYLDGSSRQIFSKPLPLEYCSGVCEDYARRHLKIAFADASKPWMSAGAVPTQSQQGYLKKQNAWRDEMTRGQASLEIRKIIALKNKQKRILAGEPITIKQMYALKNYGIDTTNMTKLQAMQAISKIKQSERKYG
jgi:ATP-dependent helicase IRC3